VFLYDIENILYEKEIKKVDFEGKKKIIKVMLADID